MKCTVNMTFYLLTVSVTYLSRGWLISSSVHLVLTSIPVLAMQVFSLLYTIIQCCICMFLCECIFLLQCYTTPLIVTGSLLFSLMISQPENYVVIFLKWSAWLGWAKRGCWKGLGLARSSPLLGMTLGPSGPGPAGEQLILKKCITKNGIICWKSCDFPKPFEIERPKPKYGQTTWNLSASFFKVSVFVTSI